MLTVYKPLGKTPLQMLDQLRSERPELMDEKLSYAGRLDPMAEGVMLVLVGDANKEREKYLALDKVYEFEMLLGVSTDTYDLLGLVEEVKPDIQVGENEVKEALKNFADKNTLPYPPFSSKTVDGKPLWWWAREGKLDDIELPMNDFEVYELEMLNESKKSSEQLLIDVEKRIGLVEGNFRQEEILKSWKRSLENIDTKFPLLKYQMSCSSGTYVRSIIHDIGKRFKFGALAYSIKRLKIGDLS